LAFAIVVLLIAVIALATGGRLRNLKDIRFRNSWLVFLAIIVKVVTNSSLRYYLHIPETLSPFLYIISLFLILIFIACNIRLKGLSIVGLGLLSNFMAIVANKGYMPVKLEYYKLIATADELEKMNRGLPAFNHIATGPGTKLYYLTDIFLMPHWIFITRIFSLGDVLITIGASVFVWHYLKTHNGAGYRFNLTLGNSNNKFLR